jgi:hypothetical protein
LPVVQGTVLPEHEPAAPAKPAAAKPAAVAPKTPTPAANPTAVVPKTPTPAAIPTPPPAAKPAAPAFDPHKLDANTNSKFKIELSHLPIRLPLTVEMNNTVYLRFVTGDATNLDNLFVPPGIQTFRVTVMSGGQQMASNAVSSEFKAKKRKTLKIEVRNQSSVPAGSASPLSPGAQIFIALSSPLL